LKNVLFSGPTKYNSTIYLGTCPAWLIHIMHSLCLTYLCSFHHFDRHVNRSCDWFTTPQRLWASKCA